MEISPTEGKTLHARTWGNGLYHLALDSEILLLPFINIIQNQRYNVRNSLVDVLSLVFVVNVDGRCILDCETCAISKSDLYHGFLFRYFSDKSHSYRRRWPHIWQQRQAGLQHPARPALLFCGATNRYSRQWWYFHWFCVSSVEPAMHSIMHHVQFEVMFGFNSITIVWGLGMKRVILSRFERPPCVLWAKWTRGHISPTVAVKPLQQSEEME